jgi:CheY-like chemotaxis protein
MSKSNRRSALPARVLFVDNDQGQIARFVEALIDSGFAVDVAASPAECLAVIARRRIDVAVIDLMMPHGPEMSTSDTHNGMRTGLVLARLLRDKSPRTRLVCLAVYPDEEVTNWFRRYGGGAVAKSETTPPALVRHIQRVVSKRRSPAFKAFIVHGHAVRERRALCAWLKKTGQCKDPLVLQDQPSAGLTVIEKFEKYAADIDVAFVLLTPDDIGNSVRRGTPSQLRARQNVVLELGYFCGRLRRASGRIIILKKGDLELPSDIQGLITIDITRGFGAAVGEISRELQSLLGSPAGG